MSRNSSMRPAFISEWTRVALPIILMSPPGCCFSLRISSTTFPLISVELFHSALSRVEETTNFGSLFSLSAIPNSLLVWEGQ